jgi:hypothetical protein
VNSTRPSVAKPQTNVPIASGTTVPSYAQASVRPVRNSRPNAD